MRLIRFTTGEQGTFGLLTDGEMALYVAELPWKDNQRNVSCIPVGTYKVIPHVSRRFGRCFAVLGVPNRSAILIHAGNFAGDVIKGWRTHSHGCLLPGKFYGKINGQRAVLRSKAALRCIKWEPFTLSIIEV